MRPSSSFRAICVSVALSLVAHSVAVATPSAPPIHTAAVGADTLAGVIGEASQRFGVPKAWISAVIRVESAGNPNAVSSAGAVGLMQMLPTTYADERVQLGLGPDPFAVRDNILAGAAYLRQMFDRYGSPGFMAAYNAGPARWEAYLTGARPLPAETIGYLARLGPMIGIGAIAPLANNRPRSRPSPFRSPLFVQISTRPARGTARKIVSPIKANLAVTPPSNGQPESESNASTAPRSLLFVTRTLTGAPK